MTDLYGQRRAYTDEALDRFRRRLEHHLDSDLPKVIGDHTTVYVTGSGGRGEMCPASDLDLFLVRAVGNPSRLDAVVLQSSILRATRDCEIPAPSADGAFLDMHSADEFERMLGSADDDAKNKFTARMLLLLESRPVLGEAAYGSIIDRVIDCYWTTSRHHEKDFLPFMLVNDVIRYWRVVLLNHESRLLIKRKELEAAKVQNLDTRMEAERYVRSYKLRFARCLTCFASLAYLLALTNEQGGVSRDDVRAMVRRTPWDRLEHAAVLAHDETVDPLLAEMRRLYESFLENSAVSKEELLERFGDLNIAKEHARSGRRFADLMFRLLHSLGMRNGGEPNPLYRHMLV